MDATGQPIELHAGNEIEPPPARIEKQAIQRGPPIFGTAQPTVHVFAGYFAVACLRVDPEGIDLNAADLQC